MLFCVRMYLYPFSVYFVAASFSLLALSGFDSLSAFAPASAVIFSPALSAFILSIIGLSIALSCLVLLHADSLFPAIFVVSTFHSAYFTPASASSAVLTFSLPFSYYLHSELSEVILPYLPLACHTTPPRPPTPHTSALLGFRESNKTPARVILPAADFIGKLYDSSKPTFCLLVILSQCIQPVRRNDRLCCSTLHIDAPR